MVRLLTDWTQRVRSGRHRSRRRIAFTLIMPWTGDRHLSLIVTMWEFPLMNCQYRENWNFSLLNKPKLAFTRMKTCNCWILRHRLHGRQLVFWFFWSRVIFMAAKFPVFDIQWWSKKKDKELAILMRSQATWRLRNSLLNGTQIRI